ncbi:MAG: hypothetical protein PHH00_01435 [Candidatus Nanoarchaeia archaeon]|nr:hypothetical protein [Candidatus Nanoarchaeia archaeon]
MKNCEIAEKAVLMRKPRDVEIVLSSANLDYQYFFQAIASEIKKSGVIKS